jgi:hypothetical protein
VRPGITCSPVVDGLVPGISDVGQAGIADLARKTRGIEVVDVGGFRLHQHAGGGDRGQLLLRLVEDLPPRALVLVDHPLPQLVAPAQHGGDPEPAFVEEHDAVKPALVQDIELAVGAAVQHDQLNLDAVQLQQPGGHLRRHHATEAVAVEVQRGEVVRPDMLDYRDDQLVDVQAQV